MNKSLLSLFLLLLLPVICRGQADTTYIRSFGQRFGIRAYTGQKFLSLRYDDNNGTERDYHPNNRIIFGLGISVYNTIVGLDLGYGFRARNQEKYGKTKSFDFQLHHYSRRFAVDLYIQQYRGFYEETNDGIILHPGMKVNRYSLNSHYVFNSKTFSYKAAFAQTERQLRSAGSFLLGGEFYRTRIRSDVALTNEGYRRSDNFQIGVNAGYAYTLAFRNYWNVGMAATVGIAFGNKAFKEADSKSIRVYPTVSPRFSCVYDRDRWAISAVYTGNLLFLSTGTEGHLNIHSGNFKLAYIRRFGRRPSKE